jgi:hypothetical protein
MADFIPGGIGASSKNNLRTAARYSPPAAMPESDASGSIPGEDAISARVAQARAALAQGKVWDRGSILNLRV